MFFEIRKIAGLALGLSFVFLTSCDLPLNESEPPPSPVNVDLGMSSGCMSKVFPVLENFFGGQAQKEELVASFDCVGTALNTFDKSVSGRYEDRFTSREVGHFIEQYFVDDGEKISDEMMYQIFLIKQLFVGGKVESISRQELRSLQKVVSEIRDIAIEMNPYMLVYSLKWKPQRDYAEPDVKVFEDANSALQLATKKLATIIERNGKPYDLTNFVPLLKELGKLASDGWPWIQDVEETLPLIKKLKKTLSGGDEAVIAPNEWRQFSLLGARGYIQYLRYNYFIKNSQISSGGKYLAYFIRSIDDLFSYLGDMVESKPGQVLARTELLEISESLSSLIPDFKVSDELLIQLMKIKVVLFGGRVDLFVRADFERARAKLNEFRQITQKFLDYKDLFTQDWQITGLTEAEKLQRMKLAEMNILEVARRIGAIIEAPYDLQSLQSLAEEYERLYPTTDPSQTTWSQMANQYVPILIVGKQIVLSDKVSILGSGTNAEISRQWSQVLEFAGQLYMRYLTYFYFIDGLEIEDISVANGIGRILNDSISILNALFLTKPGNVISFEELDRLSAALIKSKVLPDLMTEKTLQQSLKILCEKILMAPEERLLGQKVGGFGLRSTQILKTEVSYWIDVQKFLEIEYSGLKSTEGRSQSDILADIEKLVATVPLLESKMVFSGPISLGYDSAGRILLTEMGLPYTKKAATMFNLVRAGSRILIRSFAGDLNRVVGYLGLTEKEVDSLYLELRPLLSELKFVHPKNDHFGLSRFRDAGLFTDVGNGDEFADFREISRLFMLILSGLENDALIYDPMEVSGACNVDKHNSVYKDDWTTSLSCVSAYYAPEIEKQFLGIPDFLKFNAGLEKSRFDKMILNLMIAAGHKEKAGDVLKVGDLSLFPQVMQYIEAFYQVYDHNKNGQIETAEAIESYLKFETILKRVSGLSKENELKGLLTWMLKYGKPPETIAEKVKFKTWWVPRGESGWTVNAERDLMASILAFIAKAIESAAAPGSGAPSSGGIGAGGGALPGNGGNFPEPPPNSGSLLGSPVGHSLVPTYFVPSH